MRSRNLEIDDCKVDCLGDGFHAAGQFGGCLAYCGATCTDIPLSLRLYPSLWIRDLLEYESLGVVGLVTLEDGVISVSQYSYMRQPSPSRRSSNVTSVVYSIIRLIKPVKSRAQVPGQIMTNCCNLARGIPQIWGYSSGAILGPTVDYAWATLKKAMGRHPS